MSALSAVVALLTEVGTPLHYREITSCILERGLWKTEGKTPEATVNALLSVDIKKRGAQSHFQRTAEGMFALRSWGLPEFTLPEEKLSPSGTFRKKATSTPKTLSFTDAAEQVLEKFSNKKPMHYRTITEKALKLGLLHTEGQTPEATLYAQILTEIARKTKRGDTPRFVKHGKGFVGLSKWMARGLAFQIEQQNSGVRKKLHARLHSMSPAEFEELVGTLLGAIGFEDVAVTGRSGDGGIDVRGTLVVGDVIRTRMAVQAKKWKKNVQAPIVQQVRGSLGTHEQGLIITTSDFSAGAREEAERPNAVPVGLMNGEQLVALLVEYDIGIRRTSYDVIELGKSEGE
jgi:restriction system protein